MYNHNGSVTGPATLGDRVDHAPWHYDPRQHRPSDAEPQCGLVVLYIPVSVCDNFFVSLLGPATLGDRVDHAPWHYDPCQHRPSDAEPECGPVVLYIPVSM